MSIQASTIRDYEQAAEDVRNRLGCAREFLRLTQLEFASQIGLTRDRLAAYEDGRTPLRCDIALRACRHFFISEFWLAYGATGEKGLKAKEEVKFSELAARLTMALAVEPIGLSLSPGVSFVHGFEPYLRQEYIRLAAEQGGFPRIKPLASDGPEYYSNALHCAIEFWRQGLSPAQWQSFFSLVMVGGQSLHRQVREPGSTMVLDAAKMGASAFAPLPMPS